MNGKLVETDFDSLYKTFFSRIVVFCRNFCGCGHEDAEEISQDLFSKLSVKLHQYDANYSVSTWIYGAARNACLDWLRRTKRRPQSNPLIFPVKAPAYSDPVEQMENQELQHSVDQHMASLPKVDRTIAFLRFYEQMKIQDIAKVLQCPEGTVKYRISEIRRSLAKHLEANFEISIRR